MLGAVEEEGISLELVVGAAETDGPTDGATDGCNEGLFVGLTDRLGVVEGALLTEGAEDGADETVG